MTREQLRQIVDKALLAALEAEQIIDPGVITHAICLQYMDGILDTPAGSFWRYATYCHIRDLVRKRMNVLIDPTQAGDARQAVLPGFEHLQTHYSIARADRRLCIPIGALTDFELEGIADMLDNMAIGCALHADEVRRYMENRKVMLVKGMKA